MQIGDSVEAEIVSVPAPAYEPKPPFSRGDRWYQLLQISPGLAVLESWREIEAAINILADGLLTREELRYPAVLRVRILYDEHGLLSEELVNTIQELSRLRNAAAHNEALTATDAARVNALAEKVLSQLALASEANK